MLDYSKMGTHKYAGQNKRTFHSTNPLNIYTTGVKNPTDKNEQSQG